jgi:DNA-binding transcriptional LysR family regulator
MNIRWLILFSAVAEAGSFTRAAQRLNVAQPWVSAQIRKLEFELGVNLLERTKSGVALTREGRDLLPFATQVAEGSRRFRELARTMGDVRSKLVRLGAHLPMIGLPPLHRLNLDFQKRYANFSIDTERAATPLLLSSLRDGTIDCAACLGPIDNADGELDVLSVSTARPYLLMPRTQSVTIDDLRGITIAAPDRGLQPAFFDALFARLENAGAVVRPVPEAGREAMDHYVRGQHGIVVMVEGDAADYADDPDLRASPVGGEGATTVLVRMAGREPGRAAMRYWDLAESMLVDDH